MGKEIYSILVKGYLDQERSGWFDGLAITHTAEGETILSGTIADQAALHGVLAKIRDLGLSLLEVKRDSTPYYHHHRIVCLVRQTYAK